MSDTRSVLLPSTWSKMFHTRSVLLLSTRSKMFDTRSVLLPSTGSKIFHTRVSYTLLSITRQYRLKYKLFSQQVYIAEEEFCDLVRSKKNKEQKRHVSALSLLQHRNPRFPFLTHLTSELHIVTHCIVGNCSSRTRIFIRQNVILNRCIFDIRATYCNTLYCVANVSLIWNACWQDLVFR